MPLYLGASPFEIDILIVHIEFPYDVDILFIWPHILMRYSAMKFISYRHLSVWFCVIYRLYSFSSISLKSYIILFNHYPITI